MEEHPEILIIGGGVIGLTTAYQLAQQHVSVTVVDRQAIGQEASWAGAGMLPPGNLQNAGTPEARLRSYSHRLWEKLASDLQQQTGIDNGYRCCGSVELCPARDEQKFAEQIDAWQTEGIIIEQLNRRQLEKHVAGLSEEFRSGVFLPQFGQARNPRHLKALTAACLQLGVEIVEHIDQLTLQTESDGIVTATADLRTFSASRICITAGSWTSQILKSLGVSLPVKPVRGQIAQLRMPQLPFSCVIEQGRRYLVPRADGLILIGSTEEHAGFEKRNTAEGVSGLLKFAEDIVPELGRAEVVRCWSGLRPGSPDELPYLGQVPGFENLFVGAGHFRSGLQMSPGTAGILTDLLMDRPPEIDLTGLTPDPRRLNAEFSVPV